MNKVLIRVIGAPLLLAALGGALYLDWKLKHPYAISAIFFLFSVGSFHELCAMGRLKGVNPAEWIGHAGLLLVHVMAFQGHWPYYGTFTPEVLALGMLMVLLLNLVFLASRFNPIDAGYTFACWCYVLMLSSLFVLWQKMPDPNAWLTWLVFLVATNKGNDMAAYTFGKLLGRHKLAPTISPNKTWEGTIAGLIAGTGLGYLVVSRATFQVMPTPVGLWVLCASVTVAAQLGDLTKSAIKRWAGVKDSGRWLPEFGGALDMVDSFILSAPVAVLVVLYT